MERYLGFLWKGNQTVDNKHLKAILTDRIYTPYNSLQIFSHKRFTIGIAHVKNSHLKIRETKRYFFYASGRIDNKEFGRLFYGDDLSFDAEISKNIDSILDKIRGDFTFILYDKYIQNLICARDQMGIRPFYYINKGQYFSFANEIGTFRKIPGVSFCIDDQWIADSLAHINSAKNSTPYMGISMLGPGHTLVAEDEVKDTPYWSPYSKNDYSKLDFKTATNIFSNKFEDAVERRLNGCNIVGSELSGGLDSSGVTAYAYKNLLSDRQSFFSFSHVLSDENRNGVFPYKDELVYSKALVSSLKIENHYLCSGNNSGILQTIKNSVINASAPSQGAFHFFSDVLLESAKQCGVERLFSGFGGDEGVSSNANGYFHELIQQKRRYQYRKEFHKYLAKKGVGSFGSILMAECYFYIEPYMDLIKGPKATRIQKDSKTLLELIDPNFLISMKIESRFSEKFVLPDEDMVKDRQIHRIMHEHVCKRFESSYFEAKSYGIEYVYPLWDIDLLQFYLDLPVDFKYREGFGRAIFRESLKDYVPDVIRLREDKSINTIPSVLQRIVNDSFEIEKLILRCEANNEFHYIDYQDLLSRLASLKRYSLGRKRGASSRPFVNAIQILLLQDMQRSGEFDSGIRY